MSAEGRGENQKLNQTTAFGFQLDLLEKNLFALAVVTFTENLKESARNHSFAHVYEESQTQLGNRIAHVFYFDSEKRFLFL